MTTMHFSFGSIRPSPQALVQEIGGESVLLDLRSEQYFGLNEVGTRIWSLLGQHGDADRVFEALIGEYDAAPEQIAKDLQDLVERLLQAGLIVTDDASAPAAP